MTDFWIGSSEWKRWWDGEPARVLHGVRSDGDVALSLVELERTGEHVLLGRHSPADVSPGRAVGVRVYRMPEGWDERAPLREADLRLQSEAELYARREELPVVGADMRERRRRGWF
jgi:hypothetical protein